MTTDEELAALREENAREREAHLHWKAEAHRLAEENADLHTEMEVRRIASRAKQDDLRAQVAALVKVATDLQVCMCAATSLDTSYEVTERLAALTKVLNAPDLAALVAREQKRDAVIDLARVATAIIVPTEGAAASLRPLKKALADLAAVEKQP